MDNPVCKEGLQHNIIYIAFLIWLLDLSGCLNQTQ